MDVFCDSAVFLKQNTSEEDELSVTISYIAAINACILSDYAHETFKCFSLNSLIADYRCIV